MRNLPKNKTVIWGLVLTFMLELITGCGGGTPVPINTQSSVLTTTLPDIDSDSLQLIFEDDFGNLNSGWLLGSNERTSYTYKDGEYHISTSEAGKLFWSRNKSVKKTDFIVEVDAKLLASTGESTYGVKFRDNNKDFYAFTISGNRYGVSKFEEDKWENLKPFAVSKHIRTNGWANHLKIAVLGEIIEVFVNGERLANYTGASLTGDTIALVAGGPNTLAVFDNFRLFSFSDDYLIKAGRSIPAAEKTPVFATEGKITTGDITDLTPRIIGASGGVISINKTDEPLSGFQITIPANAFATATNFKVSYAPVIQQTFGEGINPVVPLVTVENGGGYSDKLLHVKMPVRVSDTDFAMGFYYDDKNGTLEGIPFESYEKGSITLATRHFSSVMVSSIQRTAMERALAENIDTGFSPGVDDWQFPNKGSYAAPGGQCAGQSVTALWYFDEISSRGKGPRLNGLHVGKSDDIWVDDTPGYRLASIVQKDYDSLPIDSNLEIRSRKYGDDVVFWAFAYSMLVTGQPQLVHVSGIDKQTNKRVGHAMVAYRITPGKIHVADPNEPGVEKAIPFARGKFGVLVDPDVTWDRFDYMAKSAIVPWDKVAARWGELTAGTIGNGIFPDYKLTVTDGKGIKHEVNDNLIVSTNTVSIGLTAQAPLMLSLYRDRRWVGTAGPTQMAYKTNWTNIILKEGNNPIGVYVVGDRAGDPLNPDLEWVDFKWINVVYKPSASPALTPARDLTGTWKGTGIYYQLDYVTGERVRKITVEIEARIKQRDQDVEVQMSYRAVNSDPEGMIKERGWWNIDLRNHTTRQDGLIGIDDPMPPGYVEIRRWRAPLYPDWDLVNEPNTRWLSGSVSAATVSLQLLGRGGAWGKTERDAGCEKWEFTFTSDQMEGGVISNRIKDPATHGTYYLGRESDAKAFKLIRQNNTAD